LGEEWPAPLITGRVFHELELPIVTGHELSDLSQRIENIAAHPEVGLEHLDFDLDAPTPRSRRQPVAPCIAINNEDRHADSQQIHKTRRKFPDEIRAGSLEIEMEVFAEA